MYLIFKMGDSVIKIDVISLANFIIGMYLLFMS